MNEVHPWYNKTILVTGGAGFIGSNLIRELNKFTPNVMLVDDLTDGRKIKNLVGLDYTFYDKDYFWRNLDKFFDRNGEPDFVFHLGAISSTAHADGKELVKNNTMKSIRLIRWCVDNEIPIHFASSASIYGNPGNRVPLNAYAYSKQRVDHFIKSLNWDERKFVTSFRYFNVFGPGEEHKDGQTSPVYKFWKELTETGQISIFDVEAKRDFIHVNRVIEHHMLHMNYFARWNEHFELFQDVGLGISTSFKEIAQMVIESMRNIESIENKGYIKARWTIKKTALTSDDFPQIRYIPFPPSLKDNYQFETCALPDAHYWSAMEEKPLDSFADRRLQLEMDVLSYITHLEDKRLQQCSLMVPLNRK